MRTFSQKVDLAGVPVDKFSIVMLVTQIDTNKHGMCDVYESSRSLQSTLNLPFSPPVAKIRV